MAEEVVEKPDWYNKILREISKRNEQCRLQGIGYTTKLEDNPFSYRSYEAFEKFHPLKNEFSRLPYCKFEPARKIISKRQDKMSRYYKDHIRSKEECDIVRGIWDPKAVNRDNKYSKGVCWTNESQKTCAAVANDFITPDLKKNNPKTFMEIQERKEKCNNLSECSWNEGLADCLGKNIKPLDSPLKEASSPPPLFPLDPTTEDAEIQKFLYNWYTMSIPNLAPKTDQLIGTGNRCVEGAPQNNESKADTGEVIVHHMYTKEELKKFSFPVKGKYSTIMRAAIGHPNLFDLSQLHYGLHTLQHQLKSRPANEDLKKKIADIESQIEEKWESITDLYVGIDDLEDYDNYYTQTGEPAAKLVPATKTYLPSISQSVVNMMMKKIAENQASTNRGIICWHSTGSGKTCTAGGVIDAFWGTNRQIIFASSKDAIASNPPENFHLCVSRLFPRFAGKSLELIKDEFENRNINFLSFAELANRIAKLEKIKKELGIAKKVMKQKVSGGAPAGTSKIDGLANFIVNAYGVTKEQAKAAALKANAKSIADIVDLDNCILIVDEVHNLFRPIANQKKLYSKVEERLVNPSVHPSLKVVILTATPGDNVTDVMKLINTVRDPTHPVIKAPNPESGEDVMRFKHDVRGIISYFDMSGDATKFPKVYDNGPVKYPMSAKQFAQYIEKYKEVTDGMKNYDSLAKNNQLAKYWQGARKYSNMLYTFDKTMKLTEFSSKLPALLEKIQSFPNEKQYCYSAFYTNQGSGQGILEIGRQMEKLGYKKLTVAESKEANKSGKQLPPGKRYIMAIQKEIGEEGSVSAGRNLHEMLKIYNSEANKNGAIVHMLLASQGFNEGLDLKDVRHIHIFEPLVTMASDLQTIGRARRFCSHAHLDQSEWTVQIHRYLSDIPSDSSKRQDMEIESVNLEGIISNLEERIKALPPKKEAETRKLLKEKLAEAKADLKELKKTMKKTVSAADVKNIDEFIYNEAQNRMKELFTIYHCMKEAAVDCQLLKKFHSNPSIHCLDDTK